METHSTSQHAQADAVDRNNAEAMPRALSDLDLDTVVGGKVKLQDVHFVMQMNR